MSACLYVCVWCNLVPLQIICTITIARSLSPKFRIWCKNSTEPNKGRIVDVDEDLNVLLVFVAWPLCVCVCVCWFNCFVVCSCFKSTKSLCTAHSVSPINLNDTYYCIVSPFCISNTHNTLADQRKNFYTHYTRARVFSKFWLVLLLFVFLCTVRLVRKKESKRPNDCDNVLRFIFCFCRSLFILC